MKIKIKYFGMLTDITSCEEESIDFSGLLISELLEVLFIKYPKLKDKKFQVAQNNELVPLSTKISSQEIVLLPPFSGG
ncbi:MoaD/ThiS family protein [Gaetbulibacter aquiaggeris]|uniref:MoaD/ThiS family protein n=1 Tax=Gaetbulibacter aquiaggeris TaxID=1735373 RepID=A0ABW7MVE0_9FLAO